MLQINSVLYHKLLNVMYETCDPRIANQISFKEFCEFRFHEQREYREEGKLTSVLVYNKLTKQYAVNDYIMNDSFVINDMKALIKATVKN